MKDEDKLLHTLLDGDRPEPESPSLEGADAERLSLYRERLEILERQQEKAPDDFAGRVMAALPDSPRLRWPERLRSLWPEPRYWAIPALSGAVAALIIMLAMSLIQPTPDVRRIAVIFEVYAPSAKRVELVGTFSNWMQGEIALKGPDAVGYWERRVELPAGQYEYLFLVDGAKLVKDQKGGPHRPDGFGHENSLLVLRKGMPRQLVQVYIPASYDGVLISKHVRDRAAPPFPEQKSAQWQAILDEGESAGVQRIQLEKTLAGMAAAGFDPDDARAILAPLFKEIQAGIHARHVLYTLQEGILKGASFETLKSVSQGSHESFKKAKHLLTRAGYEDVIETAPALLASTAFAVESGQHPSSLHAVLTAGKGKPFKQIRVIIEAGESLHHAGLEPAPLNLIVMDCLDKGLDSYEVERVVRHVKEKLKQGLDGQAILKELWV